MKKSGVEWIGEIPEDWEVTPLKKLFSFGKGLPITKENLVGKGLPVISYGQIHSKSNTGTKLQSELLRYVSNSYLDSNPNSLVHSGDFIFADTSEDLEGCGNCCYIDKEIKLFAGYHTVILQSKISKDNKYLAYLFKTDEWRKQLREKLVEVKLYSITQKALKSTSVILPPKPTQQRIASYLDKKCNKIEETIQNQQQVIEKLKAYKQSLITEAVTGKIKIQNGKVCGKYESYKDSGVEWIGKIPTEWEVGKFGRFAQVKSNLVDPNLYLEYPQIAPDNIGKGSGKLIDWQTVKDSGVISWNHLFFKGQIVYSKIRPTLNKLIIAPFDGLCSADMYPIETNIHKQFFVYMMLSQYFVEQVGLITRDRVKMPKINQNELSGILITVPTKEEQKEISDYLDKKCTAIDTAIEQKQKLIEKLTEYKKSLVYECVTGKKEI